MKWLTYIYTIVWDLPCWVVLLLMYALWGTKLHWNEGLWFEFKKNSWPAKTWYNRWGGTTFGHGGFFNTFLSGGEGIDTPTEVHEHVHVEQYEAGMLRAFLYAIAVTAVIVYCGHPKVAAITGGAIWFSGSLMTWIPNWLQAFIRGERAYLGSHHEEAAYAITEEIKIPQPKS